MPALAETTHAFQGWTLREAMERTIEPNVWRRCQGAFQRPEVPPQSGSEPKAILQADNEAMQQFRRIMTEVRLVAFGTPGKRDATSRPKSAAAWTNLVVADLDKSLVQDLSKPKLYTVSFFPLVHSPDAASRLSGLSLVEAFRRCVLKDPEIELLATRALTRAYDLEAFRDGQFPGFGINYKWPFDLAESDLAHDIVGDFVMSSGPPRPVPSDAHRALARAIIDRLEGLRRHLEEGRVRAEGMFVATGMTLEIPRWQWGRRELAVDVHNGDLVEYEQHKPVVRWSGIVLMAAAKFHVKPTDYNQVRSSTLQRRRARPVADKTARAVEACGIDDLPGSRSWKEVAAAIAPFMDEPPATENEWQALIKAAQRHFKQP